MSSYPSMRSLAELWPPYGLQISTERLSLRPLREADFPAYIQAVESGIVGTGKNPFGAPWNEASFPELATNALTFQWATRAAHGPDQWKLRIGVFLCDARGEETELIGAQDVDADNWTVLRTVSSGSWLRLSHQGRGYGGEMRAAMLVWAFDHAHADAAASGYYDWNEASRRVSAGLGYQVTGSERVPNAHRDGVENLVHVRVSKADFRRPEYAVEVTGHAQLAEFLGLDRDRPAKPQ